jgi:hypothetical protein
MPAWEAPDWPVGDYEIDWLGYEDDEHHLVVRAPSNRTRTTRTRTWSLPTTWCRWSARKPRD